MTHKSILRLVITGSIHRILLTTIVLTQFLVHFKAILTPFTRLKLNILNSLSHHANIQATYLKFRFT